MIGQGIVVDYDSTFALILKHVSLSISMIVTYFFITSLFTLQRVYSK